MRGVLDPGLNDVGVAAKARLAVARVAKKLYNIFSGDVRILPLRKCFSAMDTCEQVRRSSVLHRPM